MVPPTTEGLVHLRTGVAAAIRGVRETVLTALALTGVKLQEDGAMR